MARGHPHPPEMRLRALELVAAGEMSAGAIGRELNVHPSVVHYWVKQEELRKEGRADEDPPVLQTRKKKRKATKPSKPARREEHPPPAAIVRSREARPQQIALSFADDRDELAVLRGENERLKRALLALIGTG